MKWSEPTEDSSIYADPFNVSTDTTLKFMAVDACGNQTSAVTETYDINTPPVNLNYLVITTDGLSVEAEAIRAYRESTCHAAGLLTMSEIIAGMGAGTIEEEIKAQISSFYWGRDPAYPFYVLLVGDADGTPSLDPELIPASVLNIGGTPVISDNWYADVVGGDDVPEVAIGRLPFRESAQAALYLDKLMDYEGVYLPGEWNRRLSFFAGDPGFGSTIDDLIEQVALIGLDLLPYTYNLNMTYGNDVSAYFYVPEEFSDKVYERFNDGALAMTYIGHGHKGGVSTVMGQPLLDTADLGLLNPVGRAPIFTIIACSTGRFIGAVDSLSEMVMKGDNGIPAVFSSTEISHPAVNALVAMGIGRSVFEDQPETIGEGLMEMKYSIVNGDPGGMRDLLINLLVMMEGMTQQEVEELLVAHNHMYTLFGDPALVIPFPRGEVELVLDSGTYQAGDMVFVEGDAGGVSDGQAVVSLEVARPVLAYPIDPIDWLDPNVNDTIRTNYQNANNKVLESVDVEVVSGAFNVSFSLPADLDPGTYYIKAYAYSGNTDAAGSTSFELVP